MKRYALLTLLAAACSTPPTVVEPPAGTPLETVRAGLLEAEAFRRAPDAALRSLVLDPDPKVRRLAVRTLGRSRAPAALGTIAPLLHDPRREVRVEAWRALTLLGPGAARLGVTAVADRDPAVRLLATTLLGLSGRGDMLKALLPRLGDADRWVRGAAALAAGRLARQDALGEADRSRALGELVTRGAKEESAAVRWRIAWALSHLLPPADTAGAAGEELLRHWLDTDPDPRVRLYAARALTRLTAPSAETRTALRDATADTHTAVAVESLLVLYLPGYPNLPDHPGRYPTGPGPTLSGADRETLQGALDSTNPRLRQSACLCLGFQPGEPRAPLFKAMADPVPAVRAEALLALSRLAGRGFAALLPDFTGDERWPVRRAAAQATALARGPSTTRVLRTLARDADPRVRRATARTLALLGEPTWGVELAQALLDDSDPQVVAHAADLLARIRPHGPLTAIARAWDDTAGRPVLHRTRCALLRLLDRGRTEPASPTEQRLRREAAADAVAAVRSLAGAGAPLPATPPPSPLLPPPPVERIPEPGTLLLLETPRGSLRLRLDVEQAPLHAAWWVDRVRRGALIGRTVTAQDPTFGVRAFGDAAPGGGDEKGRLLADEISWQPIGSGTVLATNQGRPDSGDGGLLLCLVPCPALEGRYTVVGHLDRASLRVAARLEEGDRVEKARVLPPKGR